jgi:hypothetical protein
MIWIILRLILFTYIFTGAFHAGRNFDGDIKDLKLRYFFKILWGWPYYLYYKGNIK